MFRAVKSQSLKIACHISWKILRRTHGIRIVGEDYDGDK